MKFFRKMNNDEIYKETMGVIGLLAIIILLASITLAIREADILFWIVFSCGSATVVMGIRYFVYALCENRKVKK